MRTVRVWLWCAYRGRALVSLCARVVWNRMTECVSMSVHCGGRIVYQVCYSRNQLRVILHGTRVVRVGLLELAARTSGRGAALQF